MVHLTGFKLTCTGKASVHWSESRTVSSGTGRNRTTRTQTTHYRSNENYFHYKIYLAGASGKLIICVIFQECQLSVNIYYTLTFM